MKTLSEKAMLVTLTIGMFAPRKTDRRVTQETNAAHNTDARAGRYIKNLLPEESIKPLSQLAGEIRAFNLSNTLPWLNDGTRILPAARYMDYTHQVRTYRQRWDEHVNQFVADYDTWVENAKVILNGMFNPDDYPDSTNVRNKFIMRTTITPLPACDDFRVGLRDNEIAELQQELQGQLASVQQDAKKELYTRLHEPVARMVERLTKTDAVFRDSLVENIREIVALIPSLNVTDDPTLTALSNEAQALVVDPQILRDNAVARNTTAQRAMALADKFKGYV